jgi:hypothetical protein
VDDDNEDEFRSDMAATLQSLLLTRRTATKWTTPTLSALSLDNPPETPEEQEAMLLQALNRAVLCGQMAPNHNKTEPVSFRRFLATSQAAETLAEISFQATLNKTNSRPSAQTKRDKWLGIPAFLVTLVHDNQSPVNVDSSTVTFPYDALPYTPPETEQQLEDVSMF